MWRCLKQKLPKARFSGKLSKLLPWHRTENKQKSRVEIFEDCALMDVALSMLVMPVKCLFHTIKTRTGCLTITLASQ